MTDALPEKWIEDAAPGDRPRDVAARTLQNRLGAVLQLLPLAAEKAKTDVEHVHRLRVWTRRATAAMILYQDLIPNRRFAWMKKQLRRIRRAVNNARDCDVIIQRLKHHDADPDAKLWLEAVQAERGDAQKAVVAVRERLERGDRFARRVEKLVQKVCSPDKEAVAEKAIGFQAWALKQFRPLVKQFFSSVPSDRTDEAALHKFRISGKELRYAMELLAAVLPNEFRTRHYPIIEALQDRLGQINDFATAKSWLRRKLDATGDAPDPAAWNRLLVCEQTLFDQACQAFWDWCTPQMLQELAAGLEALSGDSTTVPTIRNSPASVIISERSPSVVSRPTSLTEASAGRSGSETMSKARIVDELGEHELLLPTLVNEALAANDRAKYLMSLLQVAREHADNPELAVCDLRQERLACGITDGELDSVIARSRKESPDSYLMPTAQRIHQLLVDDVCRMLTPIRTASDSAPSGGDAAEGSYQERLNFLLSRTPDLADDRISGEYLGQLTSGRREAGDSLHLLIMDLHKELNRLQQQLTTETIGGASVYRVREDDRPLISAFMSGVNETRELKFDHPGLGTTATRSGERLVIQNDIGMTDAHVLVVHVSGRQVSLTYSDIHIERLVFFQNLFSRFEVRWQDTVSKRAAGLSEDLYHFCMGTYVARNDADLQSYLAFLGSRLVFLIDWNRARKRLRKFAPRRICLEVLRWAAEQNYGHRGFLSLGGEQLIFDALQTSGRLALPPGGQLSDVLGAERTAEFLKFTLQTATAGLRAGQSEFLIRDEVSAELRHYIDTVHQGLLEVAAEHASLVVELALAARDMLLAAGPGSDSDLTKRTVLRARKWEHHADELVNKSRSARSRGDAPGPVLDLLVTADDSADGLEEVIFRVSLLPDTVVGAMSVSLNELAGLVLQGAQEYLKAVENARCLHRGSPREQVADFLEAVDRTLTVEHQTDEAHRHVQAGIMNFTGDYKHWHLVNGIADKLEEVTDALLRSAMVLRDYILGEVLRR